MAGSWSNTATTSLTLPTGATNPQQRITLDGTSDTILVYNASGALIASIAATAGSDGLGNSYPAGISSTGGVISQSIVLVYSGSPALGSLVASMAGSAGTDSFGNGYIAGVAAYDAVINDVFTALQAGQILVGTISAHVPQTSDAGVIAPSINGITNSLGIESPTNVSEVQPVLWQAISGNGSATTGQPGVPHVLLTDTTSAQVADQYMSGTLIATDISGNLLTNQTPTYNSNWAASTTFNGSANWGAVSFRKEAFDQVWIAGGFKAGSTLPGAAVFQLPAGYHPKTQWPLSALHNHGGTVTPCFLAVTTAGNVDVISQTGGSIATGDEFLIAPQHFPLGNIS